MFIGLLMNGFMFWSSMLFNCVLLLSCFYSSVTDESFVDETRVLRKYKISLRVYGINVGIFKSHFLLVYVLSGQ